MVANVVELTHADAQVADLHRVFKAQKQAFRQHPMPSADERIAHLASFRRVLVKYQEISNFLIKDIKREIDVKTRRKQMADAAWSAIKSAKSIINGDPDARAMFDMANEYLAADYAMKIGEIEDFVRMSDTFVSAIDLQNGVYEANAMKMIEEWERRGDSILLGADAKRLMIEGSYAGAETNKGEGRNPSVPDSGSKQWFDRM